MQWKITLQQHIHQLCIHFIEQIGAIECYDASMVRPGDVIWCLMPLSLEELIKIPAGHQIRPFVITQVTTQGCKGFACSSKQTCIKQKTHLFTIDPEKYELAQPSYVNTSKVWDLPFDHMQSYFFHLDETDVEQIITLSKVPQPHSQPIKQVPVIQAPVIQAGSIIQRKQNLYLVDHIEKESILAYPLKKKEELSKKRKKYSSITVQKQEYYINANAQLLLKKRMNQTLVETISEEKLSEIQTKRQSIKQPVKKSKPAISNTYDIQKKDLSFLEQIHLLYPFGSVFYHSPKHTFFLYLFHRKDRMYGCYIEEEHQCYTFRRIHPQELVDQHKQLEPASLMHILQHMQMDVLHKNVLPLLLKSAQAQL